LDVQTTNIAYMSFDAHLKSHMAGFPSIEEQARVRAATTGFKKTLKYLMNRAFSVPFS
jgi:hypothetical protein